MLFLDWSCSDLATRPLREAQVPVLGGMVRLACIRTSRIRVLVMSKFWSVDTLFFCIDLDCAPVPVGTGSGVAGMVSSGSLK